MPDQFDMPRPLELLEAWLASRIIREPANQAHPSGQRVPPLPQGTGAERIALLRDLLGGRPGAGSGRTAPASIRPVQIDP